MRICELMQILRIRITRIACNYKNVLLGILFWLFFFVPIGHAQEYSTTVPAVIPDNAPEGLVVAPTIIDEETKQREIFELYFFLMMLLLHNIC